MKNVVLILVLVAGLSAAGFQLLKRSQARAEAEHNPQRPTTALVAERNIRFAVFGAGEIGPAEQVSVRPEINGRIAEMNVDIGDSVSKGDLLFTLDDHDLQTERSARLIEIESAQLHLDKARRNFERAQKLFEENLISRELFEDSETEFHLAQNSLVRAQKNLLLVEDRLSKTKVSAPFDCTILTRPVSVGQAVSGSGAFNAGTEVMTVANLTDMIIDAHINQADVTRLTVKQAVEVNVESVPGLTMKGIVDRIAPQATIKNNVKGFSVRILLTQVDERVRPGMTANVSIPVASAAGVLAVPLAAVFTDAGERFVYVKTAGGYERRPVKVGVTDYSHAEVLAGLRVGEVVSLVTPAGPIVPAASTPPGSSAAVRP